MPFKVSEMEVAVAVFFGDDSGDQPVNRLQVNVVAVFAGPFYRVQRVGYGKGMIRQVPCKQR